MLQHQKQPSSPSLAKRGRSRFSKALPSVPGLVKDAAPTMPKKLPEFPPPPPPPPPQKDDDSKSVKTVKSVKTIKSVKSVKSVKGIATRPFDNNSPLPLPPPPSPPPKHKAPAHPKPPHSSPGTDLSTRGMSLPRRPPDRLQPLSVDQPSPTESLSSLLSAYSRDPDELPSAASASTSTSATTLASSTHASDRRWLSPFTCSTSTSARTSASAGSESASPQRGLKLPPPPPKDDKTPPQRPAKPQPAVPELVTPSPPRPEIWRRRPHKSSNSRELPGLNLPHSHGSTATSQQQPHQPPQPQQQLAPPSAAAAAAEPATPSSSGASVSAPPGHVPSETSTATPSPRLQPRPGVIGLPGRNVRPAAKQQQQVAETRAMGNGTSKLSQIKVALHRPGPSTVDASASKDKAQVPRPAAQRPPTPEYHNGDAKAAPAVDTFVSPVSPASSAGSPKPAQAEATSKTPPPPAPMAVALEQSGPKPVPRKTLPPSAPNLRGTASLRELAKDVQSPAASQAASRLPSPANDSGSSRTRESAESAKPPPPSSSTRPDTQRPVERPRRPAADGDPRIVHSDTQGPLYRGRDGTLYPEMKVTREPDPRASYFPVQTDKPLETDAIIPARPLRESHFGCFQSHRTMNRRTNRHCPLACQTCEKADTEDRWVCTFCHLRVCESCLRALNGHQRVLRRLIDELATNTPLSLSSMSRPGSALGLQLAA